MPDDGNRYEIIEGELFVSCAPNLIHQGIAGNLFFAIRVFLAQNPIGTVWMTPGVIFSELSGQTLRLLAEYKEGDSLVSSILPGFSCELESVFQQ